MSGPNLAQANLTNDPVYGITPRCLSNGECEELAGTLSAGAVLRSRAGARHLMSNPAVSALANDPRLTEIGEEWLGRKPIPFSRDTFREIQEYKLVDTLASGYGSSSYKQI